ncbi:hypothetical protein [Comamonas composti]|uniref:hypothetical protein n=1 Tax=Comamonas composti TaxID=408558 RepID=UPI000415BDE9|nr:hypothetical protein [Comamonas composti]
MKSRLFFPLLLAVLAGCASPSAPEWALQAETAAQRASMAYLQGRPRVPELEWSKARAEVARTGRPDLVARLELMRCAAQLAALAWDGCPLYQPLAQDAAAAEAAYARYLAGRPQAEDWALLPPAQQGLAKVLLLEKSATPEAALSAVQAVEHPWPRLVAAGAALQAGLAEEGLLALAVATASDQGWSRPLLAWLLLQEKAAQAAGDTPRQEAVRRRIELVAPVGRSLDTLKK